MEKVKTHHDQPPTVISRQDLFALLGPHKSPNLCGMLKEGFCYAPASFQNDIFLLFASRRAYIRHFLSHYFSPDNLTNDNFLTQKMDSEGCLPASVLLKFPRLSALSMKLEELMETISVHEILEMVGFDADQGPMIARRDRFPKATCFTAARAPISFNFFAQPPPLTPVFGEPGKAVSNRNGYHMQNSKIILGIPYQFFPNYGLSPIEFGSLSTESSFYFAPGNYQGYQQTNHLPHSSQYNGFYPQYMPNQEYYSLNYSGRSSSSGIGSQSSINPVPLNNIPQHNESAEITTKI